MGDDSQNQPWASTCMHVRVHVPDVHLETCIHKCKIQIQEKWKKNKRACRGISYQQPQGLKASPSADQLQMKLDVTRLLTPEARDDPSHMFTL